MIKTTTMTAKSGRIEFQERYLDMSDDEIESAKNLKQPLDYKYRRVYPSLCEIFMPKELPGKSKHCIIEFYDGGKIVVKGSYDEVCNLIDFRENQFDEEEFEE